jgi:hypothetical protein
MERNGWLTRRWLRAAVAGAALLVLALVIAAAHERSEYHAEGDRLVSLLHLGPGIFPAPPLPGRGPPRSHPCRAGG